MNVKSIIVLSVSAGWFWFCHHVYVCEIKQACMATEERTAEKTAGTDQLFPLTFARNQAIPHINPDLFTSFLQEKLEGNTRLNYLIVEGQYFEGESDTLGLARAREVKKLFLDSIPEERIFLQTMKSNTPPENPQSFEAVQIFWNDKKPQATASNMEVAEENQSENSEGKPTVNEESTVVSLPDRILIYHKFGSAERTIDTQVDDYLNLLSQRLSQTNEVIVLTGHTDDIGEEATNQALGLERATFIKSILVEKGVAPDRIRTQSEGEKVPIDDNASEEGRKKNRRTELLLERR